MADRAVVGHDPMRPDQPLTVPTGKPTPTCPNDGRSMELVPTPVNPNEAGDMFFSCGACGYQAIHRAVTKTWEAPRWWPATFKWIAPITDPKEAPKDAPVRAVKETPVPAPKVEPKTGPDTAEAVTIADAAEILGLSAVELLAQVKAGDVPSVKVNGKTRIPASYFEK